MNELYSRANTTRILTARERTCQNAKHAKFGHSGVQEQDFLALVYTQTRLGIQPLSHQML